MIVISSTGGSVGFVGHGGKVEPERGIEERKELFRGMNSKWMTSTSLGHC